MKRLLLSITILLAGGCNEGALPNAQADGCSSRQCAGPRECLASSIVAGREHTCVLLGNGAARCWGLGDSGQLGHRETTAIGDNETPNAAGDVCVGGAIDQITAGGFHTCALLESGAVRCWGHGGGGRLGYGHSKSIGDDELPSWGGEVAVGGAVEQIVAGGYHTCVLLDSGGIRCWGLNADGQLGYGAKHNIGDNEHPETAPEVNVGGTVVQVAAGAHHTCALLRAGAVRCWGSGELGQLGYGNTNTVGDDEHPEAAGDVDVGGTVTQIAAGSYHTCALLDTGAARCWGLGDSGQLGYGTTSSIGDDETPAAAGDINVGSAVAHITAGAHHTCARLETGAVRCWGYNGSGVLGYGNTEAIGDDETPDAAGDVNVGGAVTHVATGAWHSCALLDTGAVRCWGLADSGRLGYGDRENIGDDEHPQAAGDVIYR